MCVELTKAPVEGFSAGLISDDDVYKWEIMIMGPPDTLLYVYRQHREVEQHR